MRVSIILESPEIGVQLPGSSLFGITTAQLPASLYCRFYWWRPWPQYVVVGVGYANSFLLPVMERKVQLLRGVMTVYFTSNFERYHLKIKLLKKFTIFIFPPNAIIEVALSKFVIKL